MSETKTYDRHQFAVPHENEEQLLDDEVQITYSLGVEAYRRHNVHFCSGDTFCFAVGNFLHFFNLKSGQLTFYPGLRSGTIGALTIHPNGKWLAYAEKDVQDPLIVILNYPSLTLYRVLKGGAIRNYSCLAFDAAGSRLASVASDPDYMLTLWDWEKESTVLRFKAFSQDVYQVRFHPTLTGLLATSGMGHIKFWKVAHTFTGLKLQGSIGKFGVSELSDIGDFQYLPDGKIISGTDYGRLLVWEGDQIKCEISRKEGLPCHKGAVDAVLLEEGELITAGEDGYVRIWDPETIDNMELMAESTGANSRLIELDPLDEIQIGKEVKIRCMVKNTATGSYVLQDSTGSFWLADFKNHTCEEIHRFHSGAVRSVTSCRIAHRFMTVGDDGTLRLYDTTTKRPMGKVRYNSGGTTIAYLPESIDPSCTAAVAGFENGVVRIVKHGLIRGTSSEAVFFLIRSFKPHTGPVVAALFSPSGEHFVTASEDGTVFFFDTIMDKTIASLNVQPIGFIRTPSRVKSLTWTESETPTLIVVYENAVVQKLKFPSESDVTGTEGFLIPAEKVLGPIYKFDLTRDISQAEMTGNMAHRALQELAAASGKPEANEAKDDADPEPWKIKFENPGTLGGGYSALSVHVLHDNLFILNAVHDDGRGELRLCNWADPTVSKLLHRSPHRITSVKVSDSQQYIIFGDAQGALFLAPTRDNQLALESTWSHGHEDAVRPSVVTPSHRFATKFALVEHWVGYAHGSGNGVLSLAISFDDYNVISTGQEGGLFVWTVKEKSLVRDLVPTGTVENVVANQPDITDVNANSIQDARLKAEKEKVLSLADTKKRDRRNAVEKIREQYNMVLRKWQQSGTFNSNILMEIPINRHLKAAHENQLRDGLQTVKDKLAWESEKESIGLNKLKNRFLDELQSERIVVNAFKATYGVSTFRTVKLEESDRLEEELDDSSQLKQASGDEPNSPDTNSITAHSTVKTDKSPKIMDARSKIEARRQQRAERMAQLKTLLAAKPDESYEDPKDIAAIKFAEDHIGDFKLKSDQQYIVQERDCVQPQLKRRQYLLLKNSIFTLKEQFNDMVKKMRDDKADLLKDLQKDSTLLEQIDAELKELGEFVEDKPKVPQMEDGAYPEKRFSVTEQEIEKQRQEDIELANKSKQDDDSPLGGFTGNKAKPKTPVAKFTSPMKINAKPKSPSSSNAQEKVSNISSFTSMSCPYTDERVYHASVDRANMIRLVGNQQIALSEQEISDLNIRVSVLQYRRNRLIKQMNSRMSKFDEHLRLLISEKLLLEGDIKFAEMHLLLLFREWIVLKSFEKTDAEYAARLATKTNERREISVKIKDCRDKLSMKKSMAEKCLHNLTHLEEQAFEAIGDSNKHETFLLKLFKRKIDKTRRRKVMTSKSTATTPSTNRYNFEEEEEEEERQFNADDEGADNFDDSCPATCDHDLYETISALREQRSEEESSLNEIQKSVDFLKKEVDVLVKREKTIDSAVKTIEKEIHDFQRQKFNKLNEFTLWIPLHSHQIHLLDDGKLPFNLQHGLVIEESELMRLHSRINELHHEKIDVKRQHRELKRRHLDLLDQRKEKQQKLKDLEKRFVEVQMLKFGRIVDLEKLERVGANKAADELRRQLANDEKTHTEENAAFDQRMQGVQVSYNSVLTENTANLEKLVELRSFIKKLDHELESGNTLQQKQSRVSREELVHLQKIAALQDKEIESLQVEIDFLMHQATKIPDMMPVTRDPSRIHTASSKKSDPSTAVKPHEALLHQVLEGRKAAPFNRQDESALIVATEKRKTSVKIDPPAVSLAQPYPSTNEPLEARPAAAPSNIFNIGEIRSVSMTPVTDASKPNSAHVAKDISVAPDLPTVSEDDTKTSVPASAAGTTD